MSVAYRVVLLVAISLCASVRSFAQTVAQAGDDLVGLWGVEMLTGPPVRGEIVVERTSGNWTARVAGFEASARQSGDSVTLAFPGSAGALRVWVHGRDFHAFWVQPAGSMSPYATPVALHAAGNDAWRGDVRPIDARFSLYVSIRREADGTLTGVFRNPDFNWRGGGRSFRVERDGDNVAFIDRTTGKKRFVQPYDPAQHVISFDFGGPVQLRPERATEAVGFFPRSTPTPYDYRTPVDRGDGWRVARASEVGLNEARLRTTVQGIIDADPLSDTTPRIHSLLVVRHGKLVLDEYFFGYSADHPHDLRSASKTMTSVMAGVAMQRGAKLDMSTRVAGTQITMGNLLTHTSGKACDDDDDKSPGNEDTMQSQQAEGDWYRYFLALPQLHEPGSTRAYCSGGINYAGHVIGMSTGMWLPAFFDRYIAQPLQITRYGMNLMPSGDGYSGGGMHMLPRDLLKFGQLYLDGGTWGGHRLVSADWVKRSTSPQQSVQDGSHDGFAWHLHDVRAGAKTYATYEASGNGGQFLFVVPELQMAIVVTAGNYGQYTAWRKIREILMPALMEPGT
ncbi:MAG: serine hydrolase [bacterium]